MNIATTHNLMSTEEKEKSTNFSFKTRNDFLQYLLAERILLMIDWKGEEQDFEIGRFLQQRASILKPGIELDIDKVYHKMQSEISKQQLQPGDTIPFLLKEFQKQLNASGFTVILLNVGNDSYYIGLSTQQHLKPATKRTTDFWQYIPFGSKTGEVLYTVNCSCGSMNVWQLKRGELLTDDYCQDCSKELFDKEGNASMPVIKDYL